LGSDKSGDCGPAICAEELALLPEDYSGNGSEPMLVNCLASGSCLPASGGLLPDRTELSEYTSCGPLNFPSLLSPTGWFTAGQGLKVLRPSRQSA
jgi:hypothetical protein